MAIGISGSNGGIGEDYRKVLTSDLDAGISKYTALYEQIPEMQKEVRDIYNKAINGLKELRQQMVEGLEVRV